MARLLLLRHGQSTWNAEGRWQGWADPPLSPTGTSQAGAALPELAGCGFEGVIASDLERARSTAAILAAALGLSVEVDARLRERDVGAWSGLTPAEIDQRWPGRLPAWRAGRLLRPPGGESDAQLAARALTAIHGLCARSEQALLVVTHGGVVRLVERGLGLARLTTANLCGRWVDGAPPALRPGPAFVPSGPDDPKDRDRDRSLVADAPRPQ